MNNLNKFLVVLLLSSTISYSYAQPLHTHGTDVPDWYDPDCCNKQDCRPVPQEDVDFIVGPEGIGVIYKPTGHIFYQSSGKVRPSQDERFHVCLREASPDYFVHYCVYIPGGV